MDHAVVWHPGSGTFIDVDDDVYIVAIPARIWKGSTEAIEDYLRLRTGGDDLLPPLLSKVLDSIMEGQQNG